MEAISFLQTQFPVPRNHNKRRNANSSFLLSLSIELQLYFFNWESYTVSHKNFNHKTLHYYFCLKLHLIKTDLYISRIGQVKHGLQKIL